jgi:hypothetical protein
MNGVQLPSGTPAKKQTITPASVQQFLLTLLADE